MKAQFIYSVAALATFPIVVNAQVEAENIGKITAKKDGTAWEKQTENLVQGKYTFKSTVLSTGTAGKKATVSILDEASNVLVTGQFEVGKEISLNFQLDATEKVKVKVVSEAASADFVVDGSVVQLNYNFSKIAELLQIEYNKVTQILGQAQYADKVADAQTYSALYDRVMAIANADYTYYKNETEGLKALYAGDQTVVTGLSLYTEIQNAISSVKTKELAYLDGNDALGGLNTRYNKLADTANGGDYEISYITSALSGAKAAAKVARDAFENEPTAANLIEAKAKIDAYKAEIETVEGIKTDNETANNELKAELAKVYGGTASYYLTSLNQIDAQYDPVARFGDLKGEVKAALLAIVGGSDYTDVQTSIQNKYVAKQSKAKKNDLINEIAAFKEKLTRVVSDYSTERGKLAAAYDIYDDQVTKANALTDGADDFLVGYKNAVDSKLDALKSFIEANDQFATIANLTEAAVNAKIDDITTAKNTYSAQKAIFDDWKALLTEVGNETTSLTNAGTAVDTYAKDTKHVSDAVFKPTTIWASTISDITTQITNLTNDVNTNKLNASTYKNTNAYKNALAAIKTAITNLKTNANAATDIFATADAKIKAAQALQAALLDPTVAPLVDLTTLNVWENQVYIDEAIKARTPYKKFINSTDGTITGEISTMESKLAAAPGKTAQYTTDTNLNNVLAYLKSIAPVPADVLKGELATMEAIKANYAADNDKFAEQLDIEAANGIRVMINGKAAEFEPLIKVMQDNIDLKTVYGKVKGAALQEEINKITKKINDAKTLAEDQTATKAQLSAEYDKIKNLDTQDIATAQAHATQYASDFATFTTRYNLLNGATNDDATKQTVNGLKKKVKDQQDAIGALAKLSADQKTTLKGKVAAVQVVKLEGTPAANVTYTVQSVETFITTAYENEALTDADVTKYQGIIDELKAETDKVKTHADRLNDLETQLAAIDFNAEKAKILAKDNNENGFFVKKLLGTSAAGECKFDFNKIKADIEAEEEITSGEKTTYEGKINDLNTVIAGLPGKALANKTAYDNAKNYYDHETAPLGAKQKYDDYVQKLTDERQSSALQGQLATLATLYEAMVEKFTVAGQHYDAGTAGTILPTDVANITAAFNDIKAKYDEYYNEVNYNAQVAADNKAIYDAITAAAEDAAAAYATSSTIINTYKNFQSNELKAATEKAQDELDALYAYLFAYDAKVLDIQTRADNAYNATVSPAKFDTEESYKAEFVAVKGQINLLTQALVDKIKGFATTNVANSVTSYEIAIENSRAKVKKFSATDADVADATVDGWFTAIDGLLTAIKNVKDDDTKIKELDTALKNASASGSGILAKITNVEQTKAAAALNTIKGTISTYYYGEWTWQDQNDYDEVVYYSSAQNKVDNFARYKANLQRIKANADQIGADHQAINNATAAINTANGELAQLISDYQLFAAGYEVKATVDQIAADLEAHPAAGVTDATIAPTEQAAAEAISVRIANVYNDLFDAEVLAIKNLITTAKQENLTYSGATPTKADLSGWITAEEGKWNLAKTAVTKATDDPAYKTKHDALLDPGYANNLKDVEANLNSYIKIMADANETNINNVIKGNLDDLVSTQQTRLYNALRVLNVNLNWWENTNQYIDIYGNGQDYTAPTDLTDRQNDINDDITDLFAYIYDHRNEMVAYEANVKAMLEDIKKAISQLEADAQTEKANQDAANESDCNTTLANTWNGVIYTIGHAKDYIKDMKAQLDYYGSADSYKNKIAKLDNQIVTAEGVLTAAQTEAEGKATVQEKYIVASDAQVDVNNALFNFDNNCNDIQGLAKAAYIDAFIAKLNAQIIADSWTASSNYTTTDKNTLTTMLNNLIASVTLLQGSAESEYYAQITYDYWGNVASWGVIETLNRGEAQFNIDLAELKQAVKDMSLVEDVKGHISGNDDISTDDLEDLADIILNAQEESADMDRCDISGDGEVDVTDLVWLRYFLVHGDWPNGAATARVDMASANDYINMEVVSVENNVTRIAINLDNETVFNHFQLNVQLPEGAKVVGQTLGERVEGANLMMAQNGTTVRMLAISTANNVFAGNEGAVVYIDIEGLNGEVNIEKAIFTDTELNGHLLTANSTTSIRESITNALQAAGQKIYNMGGKMMNGLKKGVNIIRNADGSTKKVMK